MATQYDEKVLEAFADTMYRKARYITAIYTVGGLFVVGFAAAAVAREPVAIAVLAVSGALFGFVFGNSRALSLRMQAQTALCQVSIERNTRSAA